MSAKEEVRKILVYLLLPISGDYDILSDNNQKRIDQALTALSPYLREPLEEKKVFDWLETLDKDIIDIGISRRHKLAQEIVSKFSAPAIRLPKLEDEICYCDSKCSCDWRERKAHNNAIRKVAELNGIKL